MESWELVFYIGMGIVAIGGLIRTIANNAAQREDEEYFNKADQGDAEAQIDIAYSFEAQGDYTKAFHWYRRAAEQGYAPGQHWLACCYKDGIGVSIDYSHAEYWYKSAAEQGYALAQFSLAVLYSGNFDVHQASFWFYKAAEQGVS